MTAFGEADTAIEALRRGAIDYLRKPIDVQELHRLVERVAGLRASASTPLAAIREEPGGLIVVGSDLARLVALADRLHAARDLPCLIEGETGVGKELFARRIHSGPGRPSVREASLIPAGNPDTVGRQRNTAASRTGRRGI